MNCIRLYGIRYIFAYIMVIELYFAWFITVGFSNYYSILLLFANAFLLCIILNENIPFLQVAICNNWQCYIYTTYWFYGHNAIKYSYENNCPQIHTYQYGAPAHLLIRTNIQYGEIPNIGIEYIEQLLYADAS